MTEQPKSLDELNQLLEEMLGVKIALVAIDQMDLLEKNARFMRHETFKNLIDNITRMGFQQFPFGWLQPNGRYKILSGNHRVKAAKEAGKTVLPLIYTDKPLSEAEQVAIQLSHNSIAGQDDPGVLKELFDSIKDVELKYFSGLDDKTIAELTKIALNPLSEVRLDFRAVQLMFFPEELERVKELFAQAIKTTAAKEVLVGRLRDFERVMDALAKAGSAYNVQNSATAFMLVLDIFERHITDLQEGWRDRTTDKVAGVPLASILGTDVVPVSAGLVLKRAVDRMRDKGESPGEDLWKAISLLAERYLGSDPTCSSSPVQSATSVEGTAKTGTKSGSKKVRTAKE